MRYRLVDGDGNNFNQDIQEIEAETIEDAAFAALEALGFFIEPIGPDEDGEEFEDLFEEFEERPFPSEFNGEDLED